MLLVLAAGQVGGLSFAIVIAMIILQSQSTFLPADGPHQRLPSYLRFRISMLGGRR
jgi:hypothetical protein